MAARNIHIDVISDTVCPWCYVGKKNLDKALELAVPPAKKGEVKVEVDWRPFLLSKPDVFDAFGPDARQKGVDKKAFYDMKFGEGRWRSFLPRLEAAFEQAGVTGFNMDGKTGPTMDSHRLIWWGKKIGKQDAIVEELFKAYFLNGQPLCDLGVLEAAALRAGFPEPRKFLESQEGLKEVEEELRSFAVRERVTGVPFFVISDGKNKVTLSGAQPPEVIADAMQNFLDD